ncbi:MAG: hypothetical protein ACI841_003881 [Planctomycetota bacterium]|jgi:hypothetical protein
MSAVQRPLISPWNLGLLIILLPLVLLSQVGGSDANAHDPLAERLFPELEDEHVYVIRIENPDAQAPDVPYLVLRRDEFAEDSGQVVGPPAPGEQAALATPLTLGPWTLPAATGYEAEPAKVQRLLDRLRAIDRVDRVAREAQSRAHFGLDQNALRISCFDKSGELLFSFEQGWQDPDPAQAPVSYLVRDGEQDIYRVPRFSRASLEVGDWLDRDLVDFDTSAVTRLEASSAGNLWDVTRTDWDRWQTAEAEVASGRIVRRLLFELEGLRFDRVEAQLSKNPSTEAMERDPALVVTLTMEDGSALSLRFGPRDEDGMHLVRIDGGDWLVAMASRPYDLLLDRLQSLL